MWRVWKVGGDRGGDVVAVAGGEVGMREHSDPNHHFVARLSPPSEVLRHQNALDC